MDPITLARQEQVRQADPLLILALGLWFILLVSNLLLSTWALGLAGASVFAGVPHPHWSPLGGPPHLLACLHRVLASAGSVRWLSTIRAARA